MVLALSNVDKTQLALMIRHQLPTRAAASLP
jgi:hypothetical protein